MGKLLSDVNDTIKGLIDQKVDDAKDRIEAAAGNFEKVAVGATERVRELAEKATPALLERFMQHALYVAIGALIGSLVSLVR